MKKKLGLTLVALLTAFSGVAFAAQGDEVNHHHDIEGQNSTPFLTDSEMKGVAAGWFTQSRYFGILGVHYFANKKNNKTEYVGSCKILDIGCQARTARLAASRDYK